MDFPLGTLGKAGPVTKRAGSQSLEHVDGFRNPQFYLQIHINTLNNSHCFAINQWSLEKLSVVFLHKISGP